MKILIITGCVYSENCNRTDFTGLDYVVGEIVETIGKLHEVDVFTLTPYPKTAVINNGRIYSYTYGELVKYISPNNLNRIKKIFFQCNTSFKSKIKAARSILVVKEIERLCKNNRYDVIHVHGLGFSSFLIAEIGMKIGIPVLYTLHGLLGYKDPSISTIDKKSEHKMLEMLRDGSHIVTCVSGGIKKVICKDVGLKYENVFVINNAVKMPEPSVKNSNIKQLSKSQREIILSVGTISERKNQIQIIRAYNCSPEWVKKNYILILAGKDTTNGVVKEYIRQNNLESDVILTGFLFKEDLSYLYTLSQYNVMLSHGEGFGLSMIEAASFGIPTLAFSDLDAIQDIYSEDSMCLVSNHDDNSVIEGLINLLTKKWNREMIKRTVAGFSDDIYLQYIPLYMELNNSHRNRFELKDTNWGWVKDDN